MALGTNAGYHVIIVAKRIGWTIAGLAALGIIALAATR